MISYNSQGIDELLDRIEKLESTGEDNDKVEVRENLVICSFKYELLWIVCIGRYQDKAQGYQYEDYERAYLGVKKAGLSVDSLFWIEWNYILLAERETPYITHSEYWLSHRLKIPIEEYHHNLWTRELAVEYSLTQIDTYIEGIFHWP